MLTRNELSDLASLVRDLLDRYVVEDGQDPPEHLERLLRRIEVEAYGGQFSQDEEQHDDHPSA